MILLVEDEPAIGEAVCASLEHRYYEVAWERSGEGAMAAVLERPPQLLIVDVHLLDGEDAGLELVQRIRSMGLSMPVLLLTARDSIEDRVQGLDAGADDYLPKPFALAELHARVRALLRRVSQVKRNHLTRGPLQIDFEERTVRWHGDLVALTSREYALLELFARNPDRIFRSEELIDQLWGEDVESDSVVRVYIHYLRNKLDSNLIHKVSGGYRLGV